MQPKPPSIPANPVPRLSDIVTVRDAGELENKDIAASELAFRSWLMTTYGTTLASLEGEENAKEIEQEYRELYEDHRRRQVEFSDQGSIWHAVAWEWKNNRKPFATALVVLACMLLTVVSIFAGIR